MNRSETRKRPPEKPKQTKYGGRRGKLFFVRFLHCRAIYQSSGPALWRQQINRKSGINQGGRDASVCPRDLRERGKKKENFAPEKRK